MGQFNPIINDVRAKATRFLEPLDEVYELLARQPLETRVPKKDRARLLDDPTNFAYLKDDAHLPFLTDDEAKLAHDAG